MKQFKKIWIEWSSLVTWPDLIYNKSGLFKNKSKSCPQLFGRLQLYKQYTVHIREDKLWELVVHGWSSMLSYVNNIDKPSTSLMFQWAFSNVCVGNCNSLLVTLISTGKQLNFPTLNRHSKHLETPLTTSTFQRSNFRRNVSIPSLGEKRSKLYASWSMIMANKGWSFINLD